MSTFKYVFRIATPAAIPMALLYTTPALAQATKSVEVLAIAEHPVLDAIRDGTKEQLKAEDFDAGKNLKWEYQNTQGSTATATRITRKFIDDKPDAIVAITISSAQAVVATTKSIPVMYPGVTSPVATQLVKNWVPIGTNVADVSDRLSLDKQIALIKRVVPNVRHIGIVYDPGEANSVVIVAELKRLLSAQGMTLVESIAPRTMGITPAAKNLVGEVGVVYTNTNNNVVSAYESLVKVANEAKIPLVAGDTDSVKRDAVTVLGINYYKLGQQTGKVIARILKGEKPGAIVSADSSDLKLFVNEGTAKEQGAALSADLLENVKEVIR